jgi:glycosyltransferase involved in cell wall biosynthesis
MRPTVLLANHNYAHYINDAIDSVLNQDYQGLQLCIIDDGSTDDSCEVIHKKLFQNEECEIQQLGKIRVLQRIKIVFLQLPQSTGPSQARNIGIEATKNDTDIFFVLDADDMMLPSKVSKFINKFKRYPAVGVVYADYDILNVDTGNVLREYKWPFSRRKLLEECIVHSGAAIRKEALIDTVEQTGYYDNRLRCAEDYDLWLRISEKYLISHIPEVLTVVRTHNNNSTNSVKKEIWQQCWHLVAHKTQQRNGK